MKLYKTIKIRNRQIDIYITKSAKYYDGSIFSYFHFKDLDGEIEPFEKSPVQNLSKNPVSKTELKAWLFDTGIKDVFTKEEIAELTALEYQQNYIQEKQNYKF